MKLEHVDAPLVDHKVIHLELNTGLLAEGVGEARLFRSLSKGVVDVPVLVGPLERGERDPVEDGRRDADRDIDERVVRAVV
jgi:hypothetical protein